MRVELVSPRINQRLFGKPGTEDSPIMPIMLDLLFGHKELQIYRRIEENRGFTYCFGRNYFSNPKRFARWIIYREQKGSKYSPIVSGETIRNVSPGIGEQKGFQILTHRFGRNYPKRFARYRRTEGIPNTHPSFRAKLSETFRPVDYI